MERSPTSWIPPQDDAVGLARGTLRDALGALGNLAQLAGSTRVGSKAIEPVLPDVLASVGPMREALRALVEALSPGIGDAAVLDQVQGFMLPRIDELETELTGLASEPLRTPSRLGLDRLLARLSAELDAAQSLLELLEVASVEPFVSLSPPEVLRQRLPAAPSGRRPRQRMEARLLVEGPIPEVGVRQRALAATVGTLLEMVHGDTAPGILVKGGASAVEIEVTRSAPEGGEPVAFWAYGVIAPTSAAVLAAARLAGQTVGAGSQVMRLRLPLRR